MSGGGGYKTRSSVKGEQKPVAEAMLNIFKHYLGQQLPAYPGSSAVAPFTPARALKDYQTLLGKPLKNLWQSSFLGNIQPAARKYATERYGLLTGQLEAQAQRAGESSAYEEWKRVQPERGIAMQLGQAFLGTPEFTAYTTPSSSLEAAYAAMPFINMGGQMIGYRLGSGQWPWTRATNLNTTAGAVPYNPQAAAKGAAEFAKAWPW